MPCQDLQEKEEDCDLVSSLNSTLNLYLPKVEIDFNSCGKVGTYTHFLYLYPFLTFSHLLFGEVKYTNFYQHFITDDLHIVGYKMGGKFQLIVYGWEVFYEITTHFLPLHHAKRIKNAPEIPEKEKFPQITQKRGKRCDSYNLEPFADTLLQKMER